MEGIHVDLITLVIAAILNMVIGFFWYSRWVLGPLWMKLHKHEKCTESKMSLLFAFITSLFIAYFLIIFEGALGVATVTDGMIVGFCIWLGFVATTQISSVIWLKQSPKIFLIDTGCKLLSFLVMSGVIAA